MTRLYMQTGPTTWGFVTMSEPPKRGELPLPYVISDTMEPTEQVDGKFYTSKRAFRAVGRALGLTEVGNEKLPPKQRATASKEVKRQRREDIKIAVERYKAGQRPGQTYGVETAVLIFKSTRTEEFRPWAMPRPMLRPP